jgi:hypothetical protein
MRIYEQAPLAIGSGTHVSVSTDGEPLIPAEDAPEDMAFNVTIQPGGAYAVNVGYSADHTEYIIPQGGSLSLKIDQLSKIFVKTAEAGQSVNYIWYQ